MKIKEYLDSLLIAKKVWWMNRENMKFCENLNKETGKYSMLMYKEPEASLILRHQEKNKKGALEESKKFSFS